MDRHTIANERLSATIKHHGAELCSLTDAGAQEYLWQAGTAWARHAPVLFPIVGRLAGDTLNHDGNAYRLTQHGFARDSVFELVEQEPTRCRFRLGDSEASRTKYPFAFRLDIDYALDGDALDITYTLANTGTVALPASLGAHPAFQWPLPGAPDKSGHRLVFERDEPAPVRRLDGGLLKPEADPTPIRGNVLDLDAGLFADDALILDSPTSNHVRFEGPTGVAIDVSWAGFVQLGLWSKPEGADFLCIEPWAGMASPVGWEGEFAAKPGLLHLQPGTARQLAMRIRIVTA